MVDELHVDYLTLSTAAEGWRDGWAVIGPGLADGRVIMGRPWPAAGAG